MIMDHTDKRHTLKGKKQPILPVQTSYFLKVRGVIFMYSKADDNEGLAIRYIYSAVI